MWEYEIWHKQRKKGHKDMRRSGIENCIRAWSVRALEGGHENCRNGINYNWSFTEKEQGEVSLRKFKKCPDNEKERFRQEKRRIFGQQKYFRCLAVWKFWIAAQTDSLAQDVCWWKLHLIPIFSRLLPSRSRSCLIFGIASGENWENGVRNIVSSGKFFRFLQFWGGKSLRELF